VVEHAAPRAGDRVLDLGCGTGNAALLAAERGASVTGVDPAERLLAIARKLAAIRNVPATFIRGDAAAIPLPDAAIDIALSVFGVIFAPDAPVAAAELARVTTPGGRIAICAWVPDGPLAQLIRIRRETLATITGRPRDRHDSRGTTPTGSDRCSRHTASPYRCISTASRSLRPRRKRSSTPNCATTPCGSPPASCSNQPTRCAIRERALELLTAANQQTRGFRLTSRYIVATAHRRQPYLAGRTMTPRA
jgi:protein-L-isoaspartate O-methyltransferase